MDGDRSLCLLVEPDQWARCAHDGTALVRGGGVELTWTDDASYEPACPRPGGLAFDAECRAFRSEPDAGAVLVISYDTDAAPRRSQGLRRPLGLAVDSGQRLYIAESAAGVVDVVDLVARRLLRKTPIDPGYPVDVAPDGDGVVVLVRDPDRLVRLRGRRGAQPGPPLRRPCWSAPLDPVAVAAGPLVLWATADGSDGLVTRPDGTLIAQVPAATDIATGADGTVVVARGRDRSLRRYAPDGDGWIELAPLAAPGFDGAAVAVAPNGRVAFTTEAGIGWTAGSAARHVRAGSVVTYRLDSESYRTRWGRVFLDACIPPHTSVALRFVTSDDADVPDPIPAAPPDRGRRAVPDPEATPPLVSRSALDAAAGSTVFRRPNGREQPWEQIAADDTVETYEAPVAADAGRYLWLEISLHGTARVTPRVRALRIERPGHQLLRSLPKAWSRNDRDAEFLQRLLAPAEGLLHELDLRAATRAVLVDPSATPAEALAWLASFAGLVLDGRWSERARRELVAEAYQLFRRRGTKRALIEIMRIYLGYQPVIVESWQLRGLGGTVLGLGPGEPYAPDVGGSARATGTLGRFMVGGRSAGQTSFTGTAHRFCVLIPGDLGDEQRDVIRGILDRHRPAHTVYELLELGPGMRVGDRLRVALTSFIGPGSRPEPAVVGRSVVGADAVVGRPAVGSRVNATNVGEVRVG
jgi:phage tail-like protein